MVALKNCKWKVHILIIGAISIDYYYWRAQTEDNTGIHNNGFTSNGIFKTPEKAEADFLKFFELNKEIVTNYEIIK